MEVQGTSRRIGRSKPFWELQAERQAAISEEEPPKATEPTSVEELPAGGVEQDAPAATDGPEEMMLVEEFNEDDELATDSARAPAASAPPAPPAPRAEKLAASPARAGGLAPRVVLAPITKRPLAASQKINLTQNTSNVDAGAKDVGALCKGSFPSSTEVEPFMPPCSNGERLRLPEPSALPNLLIDAPPLAAAPATANPSRSRPTTRISRDASGRSAKPAPLARAPFAALEGATAEKSAGRKGRERRISWGSDHGTDDGTAPLRTLCSYEVSPRQPRELREPPDYQRNLENMSMLRRVHAAERLSFKQLVRRLDEAEGGEALSVLPGAPGAPSYAECVRYGLSHQSAGYATPASIGESYTSVDSSELCDIEYEADGESYTAALLATRAAYREVLSTAPPPIAAA